MAALTQHSHKAIADIIKEMTRPISEILGEPPLTSLENRPRKRSLAIPLRSHEIPSEADITTITRSYKGPDPFLEGGRVSGQLGPPRKRPRVEISSSETFGKKRRREEKPPRPENGTKKRDADTSKKPRTEDAKVRPSGIKLTSQPVPREAKDDTAKKPYLSNGNSTRKKQETRKELRKETKKPVKKDLLEDEPKKESKETSRKRPSPVLRIPASVIPRSEPRPLKSSSQEEGNSDVDRHKAKSKKKEIESKRSSIPRVPASETAERQRREETTKTSSERSPDRSASSSERRRPRSRQLSEENGRHQDRELNTERDISRRDKPRSRERDRDWESDRERSDRERDGLLRSSGRSDREKDSDKSRDRTRVRRDRDIQRSRDSERDRLRENGKRDDDIDRVHSDRSKDRNRDYNRDRERPSLRRSLPPSRPNSARESTSTGQSPRDGRGVSLSSRPVSRSGSSHAPACEDVGHRPTRPRHGRAELQQNLARQRQLEKEFKSTLSKCEDLYKIKDYDAYEEAAKQGFRLSFDLGLAMETELRLDSSTLRSMSSTERSARKRTVIDHYKSLTKTYATKRMEELEAIGRKDGCAFYRRGVQKVYFRMFCCHNLLDKDVQNTNRHLQLQLLNTISARNSGKSDKLAEEELSTRKLKLLKRLVDEHVNILSIFESITADHGSGFEEAGAEGYVP